MRLGFVLLHPSEERNIHMAHVGEILKKFYAAVVKRDFATARTYLADDLVFVGLSLAKMTTDFEINSLRRGL
jgi:hypothetical protein